MEPSDIVKDEIEITDKEGNKRKVTAISHVKIPGLCVTSCNVFGEFDITHRLTAASLCRGFERMWEAFHYMAELQKKAIDDGFDWHLDKEGLTAQEAFQNSSVRADLGEVTTHNRICQFPWEGQHPASRAEELIESFDKSQPNINEQS